MDEVTFDELNGIKKYRKDLDDCFTEKLKSSTTPVERNILNYVLKVIEIHYDLAKLGFDTYAEKERRSYERKLCN